MTEDVLTRTPAWHHYANDRLALTSIIFCHQREMHRDPANADWYRDEIADITAHLEQLS